VDDKPRKAYILKLLKGKDKMSTDEVVEALLEYNKDHPSPACHEITVLSLISLKREKMVLGHMNKNRRTWEWSLP